jgi:uncharacterized membrane protein
MDDKGFFAKLFDLSFKDVLTPSVVKVLYVISIIGAVIYAISGIAMGFKAGIVGGIVGLILSPVIFLLVVLVARVYMEVIMVLFRIADGVKEVSDKMESKSGE